MRGPQAQRSRNSLSETRKGSPFKLGWVVPAGSLLDSPLLDLKESTLSFPRMLWIFPMVPQVPQSSLSQPPWHHCQPQLHFPSQEYSADVGLYLAATARYSLFSLRS